FGRGFGPSVAVGTAILALFVWATARHVRFGWSTISPAALAWMVMGAYSVSQALLGAVGRLTMGIEHAIRPDYISHALFLPVAALVLLWLPPRGLSVRQPVVRTARTVAWGALVGLSLSLAAANWGRAPATILRESRARLQHGKACAQLVRLTPSGDCLDLLFPSFYPRFVLRLEKLDRLGVIRPGLVTEIRPAEVGQGEGSVQEATLVGDTLALRGWATIDEDQTDAIVLASREADAAPPRVIAVFETGRRGKGLARQQGRRLRHAGWR
ncbi:unnamed protein product, partial [marine sediment metagenome]